MTHTTEIPTTSQRNKLRALLWGFVPLLGMLFLILGVWLIDQATGGPERRLRQTVTEAVTEAVQGQPYYAVAETHSVWVRLLDESRTPIGWINRDRNDALKTQLAELVSGEQLGGDHRIVEIDREWEPIDERREVREAVQTGQVASHCRVSQAERLRVCFAISPIQDNGTRRFIYVARSGTLGPFD